MDELPHDPSASSGQAEMIPKEQYLRLAADFENYKRRMEGELSDMVKFGNAKVISELLEVNDRFDEALKAPLSEALQSELKLWTTAVVNEFQKLFTRYSVQRIETLGKVFDPAMMEALQMKPPDAPEQSGSVAQEVQAGYMLHGKVIRPAKVIVYQ